MCSDDIDYHYESIRQTPKCLHNDRTRYGKLLSDVAIDVSCDSLMRLTLLKLCSRSKFSTRSR